MVAKLVAGQLADWSAQDRADYIAHSDDVPLLSIRNDAELDRALAKITALIDAASPSLGSERYLDALSDLVSVYEARTVHFPRLPGVEILRHLMAEHGLQQKDLVNLFGSKSVVSEVLSGSADWPCTMSRGSASTSASPPMLSSIALDSPGSP